VAIKEPFPELDEILASIGEGGKRIASIDAAEGAAGNISVCIGWTSSTASAPTASPSTRCGPSSRPSTSRPRSSEPHPC
jgi:rhamnulose-1-phosphate aldolase